MMGADNSADGPGWALPDAGLLTAAQPPAADVAATQPCTLQLNLLTLPLPRRTKLSFAP